MDFFVGRGIGPFTNAPVFRAVATIISAERSSTADSYALNLILIFCRATLTPSRWLLQLHCQMQLGQRLLTVRVALSGLLSSITLSKPIYSSFLVSCMPYTTVLTNISMPSPLLFPITMCIVLEIYPFVLIVPIPKDNGGVAT